MNSYFRFYVYTRCEIGISGKQIFDELSLIKSTPGTMSITTDHLSVDFRDSDGQFSV